MKAKLSYKSKRNIVIAIIIVVLMAVISTGTYFFIKGNSDQAQAFSGDNTQTGETSQTGEEGNEGQESVDPDENQGDVVEPDLEQNQDGDNEGETTTGNEEGTTNNGTTGTTTGDVPNEEYVTERIETEEVLVSEDYEVAWSPLTIEATTTTANLSIIRPIILPPTKTADKTAVVANDIITYTIRVENAGTADGMALIKDAMPMTSELVTFSDGSITIDGEQATKTIINEETQEEVVVTLTAEDLQNGIEVNVPKATIEGNGFVEISFQVQVNKDVIGTIINQAEVNEDKTNEVKIPIITYNKAVDRTLLTLDEEGNIVNGNELEYTIKVTNTGDNSGSVTIRDNAPEGTEFKEVSEISGTDTIKIIEDENKIEKTVSADTLKELTENHLNAGIEVEVPVNESVELKFKVTVVDTSKTIENTGYVNEQPTNQVETKIKGYIKFEEHGGTLVDDMEGYAGEDIKNQEMPVTTRPGYIFEGWYTEATEGTLVEELPEVYPAGTTYYHAQWTPRTDTKYIVEYYYQNPTNGKYPEVADERSAIRYGETDTKVLVNEDDTKPTKGTNYVFAEGHKSNKLEGILKVVSEEDILVLKVYFKLQFTVTYKDGVEDEVIFKDKTVTELDYGVDTPKYDEDNKPEREGFVFEGWEEETSKEAPADKVTKNATYVAKWEGLEVTKTRTSIDDKDNVEGLSYVDQVGDVIKYKITVKNIGNILASNITLTDDHDVTVTAITVNNNITISDTKTEVKAGGNLLLGTNIKINPNDTIEVTVEQEITQTDINEALAKTEKVTVNTAIAKLNEKEYTDSEETEVKQRYSYTILYYYNGKLGTATDDRIEGNAILGTPITFATDKTRKGYEYVTYYDIAGKEKGNSTKITTGENIIRIHYGKPDVSILKEVITNSVNAGDNIEYRITVTNRGYIGTTITVTDTIPTKTTYVTATPAPTTNPDNKNLSWEIKLDAATPGSPTKAKTITLKVKTDVDTINKTISNTAKITGTEKESTAAITVNGVTVKYNEFKEGQKTSDLNIIFIVDNSQSMNYPAAGYSYVKDVYRDANGKMIYPPVAPSDRTKTRLYAAKSAINSFIDTYTNSDISVIRFNEEVPGTAEYPYENYKTLMVLQEAKNANQKIGYVYTKSDGLKYTTVREGNKDVEYHVSNSKVALATDGKENYYYAVIKPVEFGAKLIGKASANNTNARSTLKNKVNDMFISDSRNGVRTYINPAFEMIVNNPTNYLSSTKKNVIIVIADGRFDDTNYMTQRNKLINSSAWDKNEDEIYCIGLGNSGAPEYDTSSLAKLSTNNKCEEASNAGTLLDKFKVIYSEATGKNGETLSANGVVTLDPASKAVKYPIKATYMENGVEKTLFECKNASDAKKLGLTVSGKDITWDANEFAKNNNKKVPNTVITITYYIDT